MNDILDANEAFYRAFESLSIERMASVWMEDEKVICIHPGWRARIGFKDVLESWYAIFRNTQHMKFMVSDAEARVDGDSALVWCVENLTTGSEAEPRYATIQAVNGFLRTAGGWKMVLHQASDFNPVA